MRVLCVEQNTPEWLEARVGKVTGSEVWKVLSYLKRSSNGKKPGESTAARTTYLKEIRDELVTGYPAEHHVTPYMDTGREREPVARAEYEFLTGCEVETTGFILHPTLDHFGASPDGLVGADGCVEFKCPSRTVHLDYVETQIIPENYILQMQAEMLCCEREWCDFMSFHPAPIPRKYQVFRKRVMRDEEAIKRIEEGVKSFFEEVIESIQALDAHGEEHPLREQLRASLAKLGTAEEEMQSAADFIDRATELSRVP